MHFIGKSCIVNYGGYWSLGLALYNLSSRSRTPKHIYWYTATSVAFGAFISILLGILDTIIRDMLVSEAMFTNFQCLQLPDRMTALSGVQNHPRLP
ncbi:hypothetical protein DL96DRAFT_1623524 [Flagelloscypha sp. PMI_526]|nr:hypothetical protein DL96DRAFT_1623524 [Flagelloscypha sp. PMI_526]